METVKPERRFIDMLEERWAEGKYLCIGLDVVDDNSSKRPFPLYEMAAQIVNATRDIAAAYKPNSAFYESNPTSGFFELSHLVKHIRKYAPGVPVIWDAKRGDIANTNVGYDNAANFLDVDAITLHPYLGGTALKPLLSNPNRGCFILTHTSNPGADEIQHIQLKSGEQLWERVANNIATSNEWNYGSTLGIVVGATYPREIAKARNLVGDDVVMLIPGIGTQGGDLEASIKGATNSKGNGFLINVSSGISKAKDENNEITYDSIRHAALNYHDQIEDFRDDILSTSRTSFEKTHRTEVIKSLSTKLFDENCIKFGQFILRNESISPVYIDLRESITDPELRGLISGIYVNLINRLEKDLDITFDVIASVPEASISYASIVAERLDKRLVQPRVNINKSHGNKKNILGNYRPNETVAIIDDLITDGGSKFATIELLENAGLKVKGFAVLVDREQGGSAAMEAKGYPIVSQTTLIELISTLFESEKINSYQRDIVLDYLERI